MLAKLTPTGTVLDRQLRISRIAGPTARGFDQLYLEILTRNTERRDLHNTARYTHVSCRMFYMSNVIVQLSERMIDKTHILFHRSSGRGP